MDFATAGVGNIYPAWLGYQSGHVINITTFIPDSTFIPIEENDLPHPGVKVHDCLATVRGNRIQVPVSYFSKHDIFLKQPLNLCILIPCNVIGPKVKMNVVLEDKISINLNDEPEGNNGDHYWIDQMDIKESRLTPKQRGKVNAPFRQFCHVFSKW